MKKILVAIDFSDCSINALEHALTLADKAGADIHMVWVKKPEAIKDVFDLQPEDINDAVSEKFEELKKKYQPGLEKGKISYRIVEGKVYKEIVLSAKEWEADLIVAGTHGSSGFEEFWIGSNAFKIVSATGLPVITIRGGIDIERDLNKIVMPVDSTVETRQKVPVTALLASYFNAEIHVLALHSTNVDAIAMRVDQYANQALKYLQEEDIRCQLIEQKADNITRTTIEYAKSIDANLISIMTEQERTMSNLLLGTYAAQMVNHSPIPVLSVHPEAVEIQLAR